MSSPLDVVSLTDGTTSRIAIFDHLEQTRYHTTYRGTWLQDQEETRVMIKALQAERTTSSEMARFIQECDVLKTHSSEGIVNILDVVRLDGKPALLLDWFDGVTLERFMGGRSCAMEQFLVIAIQLAQVIGGLHKNNIIHREISPRHILTRADLVKLTDFSVISTLTKQNEEWFDGDVIRNYLSYVSPEQTGRMNRPVDYRTDFYSLGVTFYEMLTGQLPFSAKDPIKLIHAHLAILPAPPSSIRPDIPKPISDIVMMLPAKNAESRYQSGFGLMADLKTCQEMLWGQGTIDPFEIGRKDIPIKYSIPQVIIGRNDKLLSLIQAFENMDRAGEKIVMVFGEPGVGKSALINEIQKPIVARRGYFLSGKYDQFKKDVPYSAIVQAFQQLIRQILAESQARQAEWRQQLTAALGVTGKIITDVIPDTELLIGPQPDIPDVGPEEAKNRFNNIFSTFVSLFTQKEHPVVLFLDDLQWADSASLKLIGQLVIDPGINYLFLIGAYRHTEVHPAHPMMGMLEEIEKEDVPIKHISLEPLDIASVNMLLANFLKADEADTHPLSLLVHKKTGGNPFFINQFVKTLYEEDYLTLDPVEGWEWDMGALEQMQVTDNVVSLMTQKIEKFKKSARDILKICACIGNRFDLETMATIYRKPIGETLADINDAIEEGLVYLDEDEYKFLHDRIQEAAYSLLSEKEREDIHYRIGRYFLDITSEDKLIEKILYIVGHLNTGIGMVESGEEKERIISYNLIAAEKSKNSNAYNEGLLYLQVSIGLLSADCWEAQYALAVSVYTSAAEAAFLSGEYELMDDYADQVLGHVRTILEKARVQRIRILAMIARAKTRDALVLGLKVLKSLGVKLPENPGKLDLIKGLLRVMIALRGKDTDTILNLPEMTDPHKIMAMDIITCIASAVYMINPQLYPLLGFERILLSIKYGNNGDSQIGYVSYGLIMSGVLGKVDLGDGFGQLALALSEKYSSSRSRVYCVYYAFVGPWKHGLKDKLSAYIQVYNMGIESGEFEFAAYNLQMYCMVNYFIGIPLPKVAELATMHFQAINRLKQDIPIHLHTMLRQKVALLTGEDPFAGEFTGSAFDKETMLPELIAVQERVSLLYYYTGGGIVAYAFGYYEKAVEFFIQSDPYVDSAKGFFLRMPVRKKGFSSLKMRKVINCIFRAEGSPDRRSRFSSPNRLKKVRIFAHPS